jgi:PKD repeat protein
VVWRNGTIQFTDDTTNSPLTWDWYDPNTANPFFSGNLTNQNPKVFPRTWGYHSVNLIACNGAGCSTKASGARYLYVLPPGVI